MSGQWLHVLLAGRPALQEVCNQQGQSSLTLAAAEGTAAMFVHILDRSRIVQWAYGPVTCMLYPLLELDSQALLFSSCRGGSNATSQPASRAAPTTLACSALAQLVARRSLRPKAVARRSIVRSCLVVGSGDRRRRSAKE